MAARVAAAVAATIALSGFVLPDPAEPAATDPFVSDPLVAKPLVAKPLVAKPLVAEPFVAGAVSVDSAMCAAGGAGSIGSAGAPSGARAALRWAAQQYRRGGRPARFSVRF